MNIPSSDFGFYFLGLGFALVQAFPTETSAGVPSKQFSQVLTSNPSDLQNELEVGWMNLSGEQISESLLHVNIDYPFTRVVVLNFESVVNRSFLHFS